MYFVMYLDQISNLNSFHAIYFPAMLQALDLPLPKRILAHSHWTVNRRKMSKSIGNVVDPFQAMEVLGTDLVRYYLARIGGRFKDDVGESNVAVTTSRELITSPDWSSEQLENNAAELESLLGNFYLRITSAAIRRRLPEDFHSHLRESLEQSLNTESLKEVANRLQRLAFMVDHHLKELRVAEALEAIIHQLKMVCPALSFTIGRLLTFPSQANIMMNATEPWAKNTPKAVTGRVYALSLEILRICGILLQPFIPSKAGMLLDAMNIPRSERMLQDAQYLHSSVDNITPGVKLFSRASKTMD